MNPKDRACTVTEVRKPDFERIKDRLSLLVGLVGDVRYRLRSKVDQFITQDDKKETAENPPEPDHVTLCSQFTALEDVLERHVRGIEHELERLDGVI